MTTDGRTIWLTGRPSAGKTTLARAIAGTIGHDRSEVLDGDELRTWLSQELGFSRADRRDHVLRVGRLAALLSRHGVVVLVSLVSPYRDDRAAVRQLHDESGVPFTEVFVDTPADECERRDTKGLYASARAGSLSGMTGVDDPYEVPLRPDVVVDGRDDVETLVAVVLRASADVDGATR
jgi:adenylylsulfate kinase